MKVTMQMHMGDNWLTPLGYQQVLIVKSKLQWDTTSMHKRVTGKYGYVFTKFFIENENDWLYSRGGRNQNDTGVDVKGKYVLMGDGLGKEVKVRVPKFQ